MSNISFSIIILMSKNTKSDIEHAKSAMASNDDVLVKCHNPFD